MAGRGNVDTNRLEPTRCRADRCMLRPLLRQIQSLQLANLDAARPRIALGARKDPRWPQPAALGRVTSVLAV